MAVEPSRSLRTASGMPRSAGSRTLANRVNQFAWIFHLEKYGLQVAGFGNWIRRIPALIDPERSIDLVPFCLRRSKQTGGFRNLLHVNIS
ncbi:MAG: hypothetical protein WBE78_13180, partial [Candidatus Binataceae bacterium]